MAFPVVRVAELERFVGSPVTIQGWLLHHRSSGRIDFLVIRDGSGEVQVVVRGEALELLNSETWRGAGQESALAVTGLVRRDSRSPLGVELEATQIRLIQAARDYPISPKEHGVDFLLDHRHLWIRSPRQAAVLRLRAAVMRAIRDFLDRNGFVEADPPILTPAAAEGTTTLFDVDYFGEHAYLSQSGQLYMEALAMALGRVYAFGPTFRAEKSKTRRHLTEFWMVEPEIAFCDFEQNLGWQEELIAAVVAEVRERCRRELTILGRDLAALERVRTPFPRISYDEALARLKAAGMELAWGEDLGAPHEAALALQFDRPVFLHRFPAAIKAFYMQPDPARPEVVLAADLLAPEGYGEIAGGSERIHDYELLEQRMREHQLDPAAYGWYLDLRRWGSVPHSGFGIGIERLVAWIGGLEHVRETIPFPRMLNRARP
ncbi:asparaginyl-tRNA synthetase [Candidatus Hydrogenisulfobacillus filiaventi]|uniref:Asparagine--tRNA ligase n=1 Tax=Candidatus Hydrogenisulfobacillus filiaventi TaxID=2707344 RepID=A0A6F8ZGT8_9FIRM|nr:asparagine--tRNA ligase [Bacillota bacterium]CAB1128883.1 asparaginyl-tRNA synthetase [Candidatus Hydrogenisulfobacillus filiaventi]